jgi:2-polyprenyl-3-methyl-5-hydroxy-6-metoxy-1,4-benzoquinol methylase
MDSQTTEYYRTNALASVRRYESADMTAIHALLRSLARPGCRVLEIGGGSGRDSAFMASLGCRVTYTDGCEDMVLAASEQHASLQEMSRVAAFPLAPGDPLLDDRFDVVLCLAVIMHLNDADLAATASQIAQFMSPSGCLVLSHSTGRPGLVQFRDQGGRLFHERPDAAVTEVFIPLGFLPESETVADDGLHRAEIQWVTQVLRKKS